MTKVKDEPNSEALIAAGWDPETEVVDSPEMTPVHFQTALASLTRAARNKKYAAWLRDEFQMHASGEHEAGKLPLEIFLALGFVITQGLEDPHGKIAKPMKKSGFDRPEVLAGIHFDSTPEQ